MIYNLILIITPIKSAFASVEREEGISNGPL